MCGICGIVDIERQSRNRHYPAIRKMVEKLSHRGPDGMECHIGENMAFGFARLSIIDLSGGMQPQTNEDGSLMLICNGEIFNYVELRKDLLAQGHRFRTNSDVEVILHLYEEYGAGLLSHLNGQFAFALYDFKKGKLLCARDHFGVIPFFYTVFEGQLLFASEIKAILEYPGFPREVDMTGLDQVFSFPGLVSPRTMFRNVHSLKNGHCLVVENGSLVEKEYWDIIYPSVKEPCQPARSEKEYVDQLRELISESIRIRLRADVPVGVYLSGGLDSSYITCKAKELSPNVIRNSYSITFNEREIAEDRFQRLVANRAHVTHNEKLFSYADITSRLQDVIYYCECPIKETYNTASMALSEMVKDKGCRVILSGEGADELFAGYVGYKFDRMRQAMRQQAAPEEEAIRERLWGDKNFFYEKNKCDLTRTKRELYSGRVREAFAGIDCLHHFVVNRDRLVNRDFIHKRAYLDYKLRLVDHLVADHGDRMALANSIEVRYPFLDKHIAEFAARLPTHFKLKEHEEKYILKKAAANILPDEIIAREKFGFTAPGSPYILRRNVEYINDLLSYDRIKAQGYFDPDVVEELRKKYIRDGFFLNIPFDSDLLIIVLTFGIFLEKFQMPSYN